MELYSYDFSEFEPDDVDEHGLYGYKYLDHYWTESGRYPFFIKVDGQYAGFVLVTEFCVYAEKAGTKTISEFFVMRKYRRNNVGSFAAKQIFNLFQGNWEVRVLNSNINAIPFWRKVIESYTSNDFKYFPDPKNDWDGIGYVFNNS